ncbi:MAG: hypothetical protein ABSF26_25450 [Thermoguttaceae bacterium]
MRDRALKWTAIDRRLLRKGVNVLAVEIHRSNYPAACKRLCPRWGANELTGLELKVQAAPAAIVAAVVRPQEVQVWNIDVAERKQHDRDTLTSKGISCVAAKMPVGTVPDCPHFNQCDCRRATNTAPRRRSACGMALTGR